MTRRHRHRRIIERRAAERAKTVACIAAEQDAALARRKADRPVNSERSRKSARARQHAAYARDALLHGPVQF